MKPTPDRSHKPLATLESDWRRVPKGTLAVIIPSGFPVVFLGATDYEVAPDGDLLLTHSVSRIVDHFEAGAWKAVVRVTRTTRRRARRLQLAAICGNCAQSRAASCRLLPAPAGFLCRTDAARQLTRLPAQVHILLGQGFNLRMFGD